MRYMLKCKNGRGRKRKGGLEGAMRGEFEASQDAARFGAITFSDNFEKQFELDE